MHSYIENETLLRDNAFFKIITLFFLWVFSLFLESDYFRESRILVRNKINTNFWREKKQNKKRQIFAQNKQKKLTPSFRKCQFDPSTLLC